MNKHVIFDSVSARQLGQKVPPLSRTFKRSVFQLLPRPKDGAFGATTEAVRVKQGSVIVVAQQNQLEIPTSIDALAWVRPVPDNVAQAEYFIYTLRFDIFHHRREGFDIAVDITDDSAFGQRLIPSRWFRGGQASGDVTVISYRQ